MIATSLTLLLVLIGVSIPVGAALGVLGLILDPLYSFLPLSRAMGEVAWGTSNEFLLVAVPLFIMLGEILLRSGLADLTPLVSQSLSSNCSRSVSPSTLSTSFYFH